MKKSKKITVAWKEGKTITYHWEGSYYPATYEDPEEFPELVIDDPEDDTEEEAWKFISENYSWQQDYYND
jgi:hypothetical protein